MSDGLSWAAVSALLGLEEQVERVGQILDSEPAMTIGTVSVGPRA